MDVSPLETGFQISRVSTQLKTLKYLIASIIMITTTTTGFLIYEKVRDI